MKKPILFGVLLFAIVAYAIAPLLAEEDKSASSQKTDKSKSTCMSKADKSSCGVNAKHASAEAMGQCSEADMKACAEKAGMTLEEFKAKHANHAMRTISIEGMTCGSCESSVKEALLKVEGVNRVVSISYVDKNAVVCIDATKSSNDALVKAVVDKGYTAKIIPAVNKTEGKTDSDKTRSKSCGSKDKSSCCSKKEESST